LKLAGPLLAVVIISFSAIAKSDSVNAGLGARTKSNQSDSSGKTKYFDNYILFKDWADEDVPYIISAQERSTFSQLTTNEERIQFIKRFWSRRNPTPSTDKNEFKEEYYRRVAYANEHFGTDTPGSRSDRGRIYILWGPPDSIPSHSDCKELSGAFASDQTDSINCRPYEVWRYNYIYDIGTNVELRFVDNSGLADYKLAKDPTDRIPTYFDRCCDDGSGRTTAPPAPKDLKWFLSEFGAPPAKANGIEAYVSTPMRHDGPWFNYRVDSFRATLHTDIVPISIEISDRELSFQDEDGRRTARASLHGCTSTLDGQIVEAFEDSISRRSPDAAQGAQQHGSFRYQTTAILNPGLYRLDVVIKDLANGKIGEIATAVKVPLFANAHLDASGLIFADRIEKSNTESAAVKSFIDELQSRPRIQSGFTTRDELGAFLQIYNLKISPRSQNPALSICYRINRERDDVSKVFESFERLHSSSEQISILRYFPLSSFLPGSYTLTIEVTDEISHQTVSRSECFGVAAARN
jgi:GWxTD domain-containing protein